VQRFGSTLTELHQSAFIVASFYRAVPSVVKKQNT